MSLKKSRQTNPLQIPQRGPLWYTDWVAGCTTQETHFDSQQRQDAISSLNVETSPGCTQSAMKIASASIPPDVKATEP
jgi:hypothetical protein